MAGGVAGIAATACATSLHAADIGQLSKRALAGGTGKWDDSWTTRLGAHRTVFDVSDLEAEPGPDAVPDVMDAYHDVLGTSDADLGFVLVLRHHAVPLFFGDAIWAKYPVSEDMKEKDPNTNAPYKRNPQRDLVAKLQQRGVVVLGCNRAVAGFIVRTADHAKAKTEDVRREVMGSLMPGVILQPNGLYALARAQDVGCGFMR